MGKRHALRGLAERLPGPLGAATEYLGGALADAPGALRGGLGNDVDAWDPEHIRLTLPLQRPLFGNYFRGEVRGLEHIPPKGPVLLVGNHSGGLMIADTFVFALEFYEHFGTQRRFHQLAHNLAAGMPGLGSLRRHGTLRASHENAKAAFAQGAAVLVYPGGDWETFRPSWHSDQVEFAGRQGFIELALSEGVPIIPVVSIGGQETALFLTRGEGLAKALRLDRMVRLKVLPVSIGPPFGLNVLDLPFRLPLPAKITVQVLPPIEPELALGQDRHPDPDLIYDEVTGEMQAALEELSEERTAPVVG